MYRDDDDDKSDNSDENDTFALTSRQKEMERRKMQETILAAAEGTRISHWFFRLTYFEPFVFHYITLKICSACLTKMSSRSLHRPIKVDNNEREGTLSSVF